jgi:sterol desaturase/sphingolipid hydroxylase (fatty acid hydroxylase superfamily)
VTQPGTAGERTTYTADHQADRAGSLPSASSPVADPHDAPVSRRVLVGLSLGGVAAVAILYVLAEYVHPFGLTAWTVKHSALRVFVWSVRDLFTNAILTPGFAVAVALTLTLERVIPAQRNQPQFGVSFAQDVVWFFYETVLQAAIIVTYVQLLTTVYDANVSFLTIDAVLGWPGWLRFAIGILLLDLLYWGQHFTNHKFGVLWQFHTVHHSQRTLNFFTDFRYHVVEYFVRHTYLVIPFLVLRVDPPQIVWFALIARWYTRFYHGNIRTNLGPLRYVLVTPQSHRVHHSIEPRHRDTNFGSLLSIWDHLFGTQYRGYDEYPETGIADEHFPHEARGDVRSLLLTPLIQMAYPIRRLAAWRARDQHR